MEYTVASHLCVCGCGREVVTPIRPSEWNLTFDGETISLHPSIGNWDFPCQSHYWIKRNKIIWHNDFLIEDYYKINKALKRRSIIQSLKFLYKKCFKRKMIH